MASVETSSIRRKFALQIRERLVMKGASLSGSCLPSILTSVIAATASRFTLSGNRTMSLGGARLALLIAALICTVVTSIYPLKLSPADLPAAPPQPEVKIAGTIILRNGEVMNVRSAEGKIVEVVLNPDTKIEKPDGVFGFKKKRLNVTALSPGLSVTVQGLQYENDLLVAKVVTFSRQSQQSANAVPSAASPGPQGTNLADYNVKATYDAHFEAGSALLSQTDKAGLMHLANSATELPAYIIQVQGFADFPGNNAYDRQLSRDRGEAVIDYLENAGSVPVTHIVAPGVLGAQAPVATNEPAGGNPQNRRAEVKLLLPRNAANH
jgi:outer membrane protein OmpA-like peptidoglycan-associated protein